MPELKMFSETLLAILSQRYREIGTQCRSLVLPYHPYSLTIAPQVLDNAVKCEDYLYLQIDIITNSP